MRHDHRAELRAAARRLLLAASLGLLLAACGGGGESSLGAGPGARGGDSPDAGAVRFAGQLAGAASSAQTASAQPGAAPGLRARLLAAAPSQAPLPLNAPAAAVTADMVLDWAEFKFPDLFPKAVAVKFPSVDYEGQNYNAREYSGAWGARYLGITPDGRVFGLGDFTEQRLQQFDTIAHWSAQVSADQCAINPGSCPASGPARLAAGGRWDVTYSAARRAGGGVWLWGANTRGQIGDGTLANRALPFAWTLPAGGAALSLGNESTMVVLADGSARWAGTSANSQNGTATPFGILTSPTPVTVLANLADAAVGNGFTVAVRADGTVWGWGALPSGVRSEAAVKLTGFTDIAEVCVADESIVARKRDGTVWFAGADRGGAMPGQGREITSAVTTAVQVGGLGDVVQIACGTGTPTAFGLARRRDGSVLSWGSTGGLGYAISGFVQLVPKVIAELADVRWIAASNTGMAAAFAVGADGQVRAWGFDRFGALALGELSPTVAVVTPRLSTAIGDVVEVATSGEHTLFVKRDGSVWAVGSNASGQLGNTSAAALGSTRVPVPVIGLDLN